MHALLRRPSFMHALYHWTVTLRAQRVRSVAPNAQPQMIEHEMPYRGPPGYPPYGPQYGYHPYPQYPHPFTPHHGPPMPYHQHLAVQPQTKPLISSPGVVVEGYKKDVYPLEGTGKVMNV